MTEALTALCCVLALCGVAVVALLLSFARRLVDVVVALKAPDAATLLRAGTAPGALAPGQSRATFADLDSLPVREESRADYSAAEFERLRREALIEEARDLSQ